MSRAERLSVALCTYNGTKYLRDQLASISAQTRKPDELVAVDDASTDDTVAHLRRFQEEAPFPVSVHVNAQNIGLIKNFERAVSLATGDIIVLSDQDDVCAVDKFEKITARFASQPGLGLIFSDGDAVDEALRPLGMTLFQYAHFTPARQKRMRDGGGFDVLLDANVVTGATAAFRADLRSAILPIPENTGRLHDSWIALIASAIADVDYIGESLIRYRQHESQVTGIRQSERPALLGREHYQQHVDYLELVDARLTSLTASAHVEDSRRRLASRLEHVRARATMPAGRLGRLPIIMREAVSGRYGKYSNGLWSVVRDLMSF